MSVILMSLVVMNFFLTCWSLYLAHQRTKMQREDMHYKRTKRQKEGGAHRAHGGRSDVTIITTRDESMAAHGSEPVGPES